MDEVEFRTIEELYNRVKPALYSKLKELKSMGFNLVREKDIWNYLVNNNWKTKNNLELSDIVSDILYADNYLVNNYVVSVINKNRDGKNEENI